MALALAVVLASAVPARAESPATEGSVRRFVQEFYDWYAPLAVQKTETPAFEAALKQRPSAFRAQLVRALQEDVEAQAKVTDDIVGIDWDPFLSTQDPGAHYVVGRVSRERQTYRVEVHAIQAGKTRPKPDVIAEVADREGQWQFVDFHSPDGDGLLSALAKLKKSREKAHD
jgi:hypothetical protein